MTASIKKIEKDIILTLVLLVTILLMLCVGLGYMYHEPEIIIIDMLWMTS
jgi:hypothetical protein